MDSKIIDNDGLWIVYENNIPVVIKSPILKLYLDFCPSEHIKESSSTPNSTFISSASVFVPFSKNSKEEIRKFSDIRGKGTKMRYLRKFRKMVDQQHVSILSLCLIETEEERYEAGLWNIKENLDNILGTNIGGSAGKDKIVSFSSILLSLYYSVTYFIFMAKLYEYDMPEAIEIIIDRPPSYLGEQDLELLRIIHGCCRIWRIPFYHGPISYKILGEDEKDPPGLMIADMMAHICASWVVLKELGMPINESDINERSKQLPKGYTDEHYEHFRIFNNLLVDKWECFSAITIKDFFVVYNAVMGGIVLGETDWLRKRFEEQ